MLHTPSLDDDSSSSGYYSNSKWKWITLCSCLLLGLTQISMEQWHPLIPVGLAIQKDDDDDDDSGGDIASSVIDVSSQSASLESEETQESYIRGVVLKQKEVAVVAETILAANDVVDDHDDTTPQFSTDFIREHFPECVSESGIIDLQSVGMYLPVLPGVQPRYDHESCFIMKARYNCAHPPDYDKPVASDYELVLNLGYANNTKPCRVRSLVDALGGPVGLSQRPNPTTGTDAPTRIALHGSSYVRQMWEAMTCGFRQNITQLMAKQPGPNVSLEAMERRNNTPIEFSEIGKPIRSTQWIQNGKCYGVYKNDLAAYYHKDAPRIPTDTIDGCNDSIAMVRFQNAVEVYFLFRPNDFSAKALNRIYSDYFQITGGNPTSESSKIELDALIWNVGLKKPENILPDGVTTKRKIGVDPWLSTLMAMQRRDLGVYFGADNPWITTPPDGHPCMPGIPDDEVNLILYILYTGYTVN